MRQAGAALLCLGGAPISAGAQAVLPVGDVVTDTYIESFPETGARIAVFEAGQGFWEELFERDTTQIFDRLQPGQPPLAQADIILARIDSWSHAAEVYADTPLQSLSEAVRNPPDEAPVHIQVVEIFGGLEVLPFTFLDQTHGDTIHARCMAALSSTPYTLARRLTLIWRPAPLI